MKRQEIIKMLLERDGDSCAYCGDPISCFFECDVHIEHIIPKCKGGKNELSNYFLSCRWCNLEKGKKSLEEWSVILTKKITLRDIENKYDCHKLKKIKKWLEKE